MKYKVIENFNEALNAKKIREKVFMEEQGFENEFDEIDQQAIHIELYDEDKAIGCARMYSIYEDTYILGRIAILKEYRGKNYGSKILDVLEEECKKRNVKKIELSAQVRASHFYEKNGYKKIGEEYLDEYCPHIRMVKKLD